MNTILDSRRDLSSSQQYPNAFDIAFGSSNLPHRTLTTVASYARLVSEPKAPALDAAAKVRQNNETTKPNMKKLYGEPE